jgi:hypothetical protein
MSYTGLGSVSVQPTRIKLNDRHQSFCAYYTATSDGSGNISFDCDDLWSADNSAFHVFATINRTAQINFMLGYVVFSGAKISGQGVNNTLRMIDQYSRQGATFSLSYYTTASGVNHGTRVIGSGMTASVEYSIMLHVINVGRASL